MARYRGTYSFRGDNLRSKFEMKLAVELDRLGVNYEYEKWQYEFFTKVSSGVCNDCLGTHVAQRRWYTPDFFLPNGIVIEAKGNLTASNRTILKAVRDAHDSLDLRLVFMADNKINRNSVTRYSDWAEQFGFKYAVGEIPEEWINEGVHEIKQEVVKP